MIPLRDPDLLRVRAPWVTRTLLAVNVLVGIVTLLIISDLDELLTVYRYGAIPWELTGGEGLGVEQFGTPAGSVILTSIRCWRRAITPLS